MLHSKPSHSPHLNQAHFHHPASHPSTHPPAPSPAKRLLLLSPDATLSCNHFRVDRNSFCLSSLDFSANTSHSLDITISIQDLAASSHLAPAVGSTNCVYLNPVRLLAQRVATGKRSMHRHASPRQSTCSATADTFLRSIAQTLRQSNNTHKHTCP